MEEWLFKNMLVVLKPDSYHKDEEDGNVGEWKEKSGLEFGSLVFKEVHCFHQVLQFEVLVAE